MVVRLYEDEKKFITKVGVCEYRIEKGFQPGMNVEGVFYANEKLAKLMYEELEHACR